MKSPKENLFVCLYYLSQERVLPKIFRMILTNCIVILTLLNLIAPLLCMDSDRPFRMQKLNLVWEKASKKLHKEKLKSLYTDLKYQDKEELSWKKLKSEGLDKDGLKEALIRKSFNAILQKYDLRDDFDILRKEYSPPVDQDNQFEDENRYMKAIFRDKKLNKLWLKAEQQGFSDEQLKTLKEEFQHHQDKIDQYYLLMEKVNQGSWFEDDPDNTLSHLIDSEEPRKKVKTEANPHQVLKEKHSELKAGYDYLNTQVIPNLKNMEFDEPQVNSLWELAKNASFSDAELASLRGELHHFEHRIKKLKYLSEQDLNKDDQHNLVETELQKRQKRLKEYSYKVEKVHKELADRIMLKHTEL